ncbi:ABC-three component system protein [Vibrio harveyi]
METISKSVLCDATPSWNGYNYQGKVGLYVCLVNILEEANKGINKPSFADFLNQHHIEYEWIEDFAIKRDETYLSLHQVKHKSENRFKDHLDAIETILLRKNGVLSDSDIFKYFTIISRVKGDAAKTKAEITNELATHKLRDAQGKPMPDWKSKLKGVDSRFKEPIEKCFSDFNSLSTRAFGSSKTFFHTVEDVEKPNKDILKISKLAGGLISTLVDSKSLACQDIYLSFDKPKAYQLSLSDDALSSKIDQLISKILTIIHSGETFQDTDIKLYRTALCALIDLNLVKRHQHIRDKVDHQIPYLRRVRPSIYFKDIIDVLKQVFHEQNKAYWNLVCRENFETAYKEKLHEIHLALEKSYIDEATYNRYQENLEVLRNDIIDSYLPEDCITFLKQIYPHCTKGNLKEHQFYSAISEPKKIKSIFLNFIQKLIKQPTGLNIKCKNNRYTFQPTCIDLNENDEIQKLIAIDLTRKGLIDNIEAHSIAINNIDYIIVNSNNPDDEIDSGLTKITEVESYDSNSKVKDSDKFTEKKKVNFIDTRRALEEING